MHHSGLPPVFILPCSLARFRGVSEYFSAMSVREEKRVIRVLDGRGSTNHGICSANKARPRVAMQSLTSREDTPPASDYFSSRNFFWQVLIACRASVIENVNSNIILVHAGELAREWGNRNLTGSRFPRDDGIFNSETTGTLHRYIVTSPVCNLGFSLIRRGK